MMDVADLALEFVHERRKEDEELPRGSIEEAIRNGEVTIEEIVQEFRSELNARLKPWGTGS